ncbi:MAG TPA: hypothetical protein VGE11_01895 [Pseudonocardia sp.]
MSKTHPQQNLINKVIERPDAAAVAALAAFSTTQIADSGAPVGVVSPRIARIAGGREVCGPAVTVWTRPGDILYVLKSADMIESAALGWSRWPGGRPARRSAGAPESHRSATPTTDS